MTCARYITERVASRLERMRAMLDQPPIGRSMLDLLAELDRLHLDVAALDAGAGAADAPRTVAALCGDTIHHARALHGLTYGWASHAPDADTVECARRLAAGVTRCAGALSRLVEVTRDE